MVWPILKQTATECEIEEPLVEFPTCKKVKQMKLFKNNRVDLKFHSPQLAEQFVNKYLGTAS